MAAKAEDIKYRYNNCQELLDDINNLFNDDSPLIKPYEQRNFHLKKDFDIGKSKSKIKYYEK
jgi:hypothetical protein